MTDAEAHLIRCRDRWINAGTANEAQRLDDYERALRAYEAQRPAPVQTPSSTPHP